MAMTNGARALRTRVDMPDAVGDAVKLDNGLLKTGKGLVVPPSGFRGDDTRSGALAALTAEEKSAFGIRDPKPQPAPDPPKVRSRRRSKAQEPEAPAAPSAVKVRLVFDGVGAVPVEYAHVHFGDQCAVLGLTAQSYVPRPTTVSENNELQGVIRFEERPGEEYAYMGHRFVDSAGVQNVVLIGLRPEGEDNG